MSRCRHALPALILMAALSASLSGAAPPVLAQAGPGIVPGNSIGPARLGMTEGTLAALLGPSKAESPTRRVYPRYGLAVDFERGVAARITTTAAKYRTIAGAGVGTGAHDSARLVGDINSVTTASRNGTTVWYEFQGIGFVFRGGRAVEAFVTQPVPFGSKPPMPSGPASPGAPPSAVEQTPAPAAGALLRDIKAEVSPTGAFYLTGTVVNTGPAPAGPLYVTGLFTRISGAQVETKTTIQGPLAPGAGAPFTLQLERTADVVVRYQVSAVNTAGAMLATTAAENVPLATYADYARGQIRVKVDIGAPSNAVGPPAVQALVAVADTGAIPARWVQQVSVQVRYSTNLGAGVQNTQLRPGQTQTVLLPAGATIGVPLVTGVVLGGG
ncbi:MAG TPA: hypothetical protein VKW09_06345 [bacterium]|nr:hypothetical protein [bacterium]